MSVENGTAARTLLAQIQEGKDVLQLWERRLGRQKEYEMVINGVFIMATYNRLSSELLIRNALRRFPAQEGLQVLIGGLGMGFTVREACRHPGIGLVDVVELEATVIEWNRSYFTEFNHNCLSDPRVCVLQEDFYDYVANTVKEYDIIGMDIDNGPMMLVSEGNRRVYDVMFFRRTHGILKPGGVFAVWSCNPAPALLSGLAGVFADAWLEVVNEEHQGESVPYYLYFGRKTSCTCVL